MSKNYGAGRESAACRVAAAGVALMLALQPVAASAQAPDAGLRGRTMTLFIGFGPGGTYDLYARLIARHMGRHIPGNPSIVAQAMPGAGSITLANYLFNAAPKDGMAIGIVAQAVALEEALKSSGIAYRSAQFNWIGRATSATELLLAWHGSGVRTIEDTRRRDVPVGGTGPASPSEGIPRLLNATYGARFRIISGYQASAVVLLAMEKGEVDVGQTSWSTIKATKADWLAGKLINILTQSSLVRDPELTDVPTVAELGRTADDRALLAFYASSSDIGRSFLAPPGLAADRVALLRRAFDATMTDADYVADVEKAKGEIKPMRGEELQRLIADTVQAPPELVARMKSIIDAGKETGQGAGVGAGVGSSK